MCVCVEGVGVINKDMYRVGAPPEGSTLFFLIFKHHILLNWHPLKILKMVPLNPFSPNCM